MQKSNFNLTSLVVIVVLLVALIFALYPVVIGCRLMSEATAVASKGKDIHVAITHANTEREALGLGSLWPCENPPLTNSADRVDISKMNFTNSTDYFRELYDGGKFGTEEHSPYITDFDFGLLAGGGVMPHTGPGPLKSENNMWTIANNVRDEMEDIIPVLVTRNLAAGSLPIDMRDIDLEKRFYFDDYWSTPFGEKLVVFIRKGGGAFTVRTKYLLHLVVYNRQSFSDYVDGWKPPPPLGYLTPNKKVVLSDAVYNACAAFGDNPNKTTSYYDRKNYIAHIFRILACIFLGALFSGAYTLRRAAISRKTQAGISVMSSAFWVILWLATFFYLCMGVILCHACISIDEYSMAVVYIPLTPAIIFQIWGCVYLVLWIRRNSDLDAYRTAFKTMIRVPITAFILSLVFSFVYLVFFVLV